VLVWPTDGRNLLLPIDRQLPDAPENGRTFMRIGSTSMRPYRSLDDLPRWTEAEDPADDGDPVEPLP
jgi:hypothetical protein